MITCPACQHELDDAARALGRCPACNAALHALPHRTIADVRTIAPVADDRAASNDQTIDVPSGGVTGESIDIEVLESRHSSATIPDAPAGAPASPKSPTIAFGPEQTLEFAGTGSDPAGAMLTSQWESGVSDAPGDPNATIKQKETVAGSHGSSSSLIVKSRHVMRSGATMLTPPTSPAEAPDYELLDVIGEGGMGVVYAARQSSIARTVALKMLKANDADAGQRDKFISEAVVTGELDHPNIVPIYDLGANDDGALFYSMKRVKGTPWHKVLKKKSLEDNLNILLRVADAVAFAHVNGVLHRDLKPENIMLGDFGEVLVMDWGLARVSAEFPNAASVAQSDAMGGTPAYMAPEMATGPLERVSTASDVYLLGAILYEIVTGRPPHSGKTVMACLFAAAKNQITPTDKTGELVDIAAKAMATKPEDRYSSVQEFQAAVREYQAHAESLRLLHHARGNLDSARQGQDYDLYARGCFALEESLALWPGNARARSLLDAARLDYARLALTNGDFDLGASLLDPANEAHREVLAQLDAGRRERALRQRRFKLLKGAVACLIGAIIAVVSLAYVAVSNERDEAVRQRGLADIARGEAEQAHAQAQQNYEAEQAAHRVAEVERRRAVDERNRADRAARDEAYAAYVARIGLTNAKLDENAFDRAVSLLDECPPELRNWEWGRLRRLTQLSERTWHAGAPLEAVAFSPDGAHFATGDWNGNAVIWSLANGQRTRELPHGQYVHAVAYDAAGERLASGSSDGTINVYRASDGERLTHLVGHTKPVSSVRFSPDGRRLLSSSIDETARLWDVETGEELQTLQGHSWWVWAAEFSSDGKRLVTAGQDGKAIVWQETADGDADPAGSAAEPPKLYSELTTFHHESAIYCAKFSPLDGRVATGDENGRVRMWNPDEVQSIDVSRRVRGLPDIRSPFREFAAHPAPVRALAFSPDGLRLASGAQDNTVAVWDLATGALYRRLRGHASHVRGCEFSPDGEHLLSAGRDAQILLWRPDAYAETRSLPTDPDLAYPILSARFSRDGASIVTASKDRTASLWDVESLERTQWFQEGHEFLATSAEFFAGGERLATAAGDGTARIWNVGAGAEMLHLGGTGQAAALDVSDDGRRLATGGDGGEAYVWDALSGEKLATLAGHDANVSAVRFAPDGRLLAVGDESGRCRLWHYDHAAKTWTHGRVLRNHSREITALAFVEGGARLITASGDNTCGQWDVATGREFVDRVLKHPEWVADMAVSKDGRLALTCCDDGKLRLWSLGDARLLRTLQTANDASAFTSVDLSSDGRLAVGTSAAEGTVRIWDLSSGSELEPQSDDGASHAWLDVPRNAGLVWAAHFAPDNASLLVVGGNDASLLDVASRRVVVRFSPHGVVASADVSSDGSRVVTGSWDRTAKIWDVATGRVIAKLEALHAGYINSVAFSPDGARILTASDDGTARLWDARNGQALEIVLRGHSGSIHQACFSPDGRQILTAGQDKTARLWSAETGAPVLSLAGHEWAVLAAAFSGDGQRIITGSEDNTARVWDAVTGKVLHTLAGHTGAVTAVALSPDGSRALTGSHDHHAKLWDASTGKEILTLSGHSDEVASATFSPDGLQALTSGRDGRVNIWPALDWKASGTLQAQTKSHR